MNQDIELEILKILQIIKKNQESEEGKRNKNSKDIVEVLKGMKESIETTKEPLKVKENKGIEEEVKGIDEGKIKLLIADAMRKLAQNLAE